MTSAFPPPPPAPPLEPPAWQPPPPPPGAWARPQLRRSRSDKVIGGVGGGLAEYSGVDALLWRVGFVALALAGGTGVLVYLLLWLLMPAATSVGEQPTGPRRPAGPRSPVPGITLAGLLIVVGALALVGRFTDWDLDATVVLGGALLVVGAGLVVASFTGGRTARGALITLGAVLSLALIAAESVPWDDVDGGLGDRTFVPTSAAEVRSSYEGGVGDMTIDLSRVDVGDLDEPIRTKVDHGLGDVQIILPRDADVQVDVDSGMGEVSIFGRDGLTEGSFDGTGPGSWIGDDEIEIYLDVDAGVGNVEVDRG
ncbi:phage shock protein C (PspC) family protein [Blastococcus aurantiacus]|uniref:Phage shock protein C (PspC) family protein n=1 Tax=Blastococcus aurantiacus TaxID=1550231 RepID=A0A1G7PR68_9ACTN|nr:PspC domain-containing protein [Blastococcus aurantiacus]SDF88842.1 phage shock protein C (PspC) family protein [Blastococcus aurantiacus]